MSKATPRINPQEYKTKAEAVLDMLKKGLSVKQIRNHMAVSESYIYLAKKKLAEAGLAAAEAAEEAVNETLHNITQGRQKYRGTMERKVPGGPATVVRATTEDRVERILDKRGTSYGTFLDNARVTQRLKAVAHNFAGQNNKTFDADQAEALDMIFTKVGRILNGDSNHIDSWIDIAGYATLVADRLQGKTR
jgi:transposase